MNWVCINGEFVPSEEAKISVWDHGFLYGDGLFETMRAYSGKVFALAEHLVRLRQGAEILRINIKQTDEELNYLLAETIERNHLADAYIRMTYTRGPGAIGIDPALCPETTLVIMAKEVEASGKIFREGITLGICPVRRNHPGALPPAVKSLNFLNNILAKIWAKENGYADALLLSHEGWITETTVSNIFFIKQGVVFTPACQVGLLAGVTRQYVIKGVERLSLPCCEGVFSPEDLFAAEEIFLTNSGSEIIPVVSLSGKKIGSSLPGEFTGKIKDSFSQIVNSWT